MMLIPCGPSAVPTGGAGVACPAGIWIFTIAASFFFAIALALSVRVWRALWRAPLVSELGHLAELELDRSLPAEDVHEHLELRPIEVDLADRAVEVGERSGGDAHLLAFIERETRPRLLLGC